MLLQSCQILVKQSKHQVNYFTDVADGESDRNPTDEVPARPADALLRSNYFKRPCNGQSYGHRSAPDRHSRHDVGQHQKHQG